MKNFQKAIQLIFYEGESPKFNLNSLDENGWVALHYACLYNDLRFMNVLIYNDADVNLRGKNGVTPLMIAVAK